jgi:hypothetical protein
LMGIMHRSLVTLAYADGGGKFFFTWSASNMSCQDGSYRFYRSFEHILRRPFDMPFLLLLSYLLTPSPVAWQLVWSTRSIWGTVVTTISHVDGRSRHDMVVRSLTILSGDHY